MPGVRRLGGATWESNGLPPWAGKWSVGAMSAVADAEPGTAHAARDGREAKRLQPDAATWLSVWHPRRVR